MKKIYLSTLLLFISLAGFSQDTLFTKSGKMIPAKVLEVRASEVQYKSLSDNTENQYSVIDISKLNSIHYANGSYDIFLADSSSNSNKVANSNNITEPETLPTPDPDQIKKAARAEAIADVAFIGLRVLGFACRIALEIVMLGAGGSGGGSHDHHSSGTYGKRGN